MLTNTQKTNVPLEIESRAERFEPAPRFDGLRRAIEFEPLENEAEEEE